MDKMPRSTFLKISALGFAGAASYNALLGPGAIPVNPVQDDALLQRVIQGNDLAVTRFIEAFNRLGEIRYLRMLSDAFATCAASYCHPGSQYHRAPEVLAVMDGVLDKLLGAQYPNGTLDSGGNRQSPPDTAFFLDNLCPAAVVLMQTGIDGSHEVQEKLKGFIQKAGEGVRTGGVHTPNHRWIVSAVLARLYGLFRDEKYLHRLDEWLAEGIYLDADGNYPERSRNYALVESHAFVTMGRLLNRPELFDIVKKNLETNYYYLEPGGHLVTLDSRRQDQNTSLEMARYYFLYKFLAHHFQDDFLAAVAREIEGFDGFDRHVLSKLIVFMEVPALLSELPVRGELPTDYVKEIAGSGLVRIRRGNISASIFGGNDQPLIIASGRSNNPTFFALRKGAAILHSVRLSTSFFSTGYVRSDGVRRQGNEYTLSERKEAYYYHPLPADKRNAAGDYTLSRSLDGRFWSKMDFDHRQKDTLTLDSTIKIVEEDGSFRMEIDVVGPEAVEVTLEFCFDRGGKLEGVVPGPAADDFFLESGHAKYTSGNDTIEIGPGRHEHNSLRGLDGEVYSTHFGSIKRDGLHVYVTGLTPFRQVVRIS